MVQQVYDRTLIFDQLSDIVNATAKNNPLLLVNTL
jgi:hypothetical protein